MLYLDLDADGDLTDDGERFQGTYDGKREASGTAVSITVGDVPVPGTELVHRRFRVSTVGKKGRDGVWFQMWWDGEEQISGGYGAVGTNTTVWSTDRAKAPVLRPTPLGPLTFGLYAWGADEVVLTRGKDEKVYRRRRPWISGAASSSVTDRFLASVLPSARFTGRVSLHWPLPSRCQSLRSM